MKPKPIAMCLSVAAAAATLLLSGCLMRQTVTRNGEVVKEGYVVKRPLKEAVRGSE
jgi:outer membrane protein assembly factor BamE (lipoprotein component of BamABCDE complex)